MHIPASLFQITIAVVNDYHKPTLQSFCVVSALFTTVNGTNYRDTSVTTVAETAQVPQRIFFCRSVQEVCATNQDDRSKRRGLLLLLCMYENKMDRLSYDVK